MKRLAAILLGLALLCPAGLGETFQIDYWSTEETSGYALLLKDDGTALTPPETYDSLVPLRTGDMSLFRGTRFDEHVSGDAGAAEDADYQSYHREALVDAEGRALTDFLYYDLTPDPGGAIIGRRWPVGADVLDASGKTLFSGDYMDVRPTGEGSWLALRRETWSVEGQTVYAIVAVDAKGSARETGFHTGSDRLEPFYDGLCPVNDIRELGGRAAILNAKGEQAGKQTFEFLSDPLNGYVIVHEDDLYGLYKLSGDYLLPPLYDYIHLDDVYSQAVYIATQGADVEVFDAETGEKRLSRRCPGTGYAYCWMLSDETLHVGEPGSNLEICDLSGHTLFRVPKGKEIFYFYTDIHGIPERYLEAAGEWPYDKTHIIDLNGAQIGPDWQRIDASLWQDGHGRYVVTRYALNENQDGEAYPIWASYRSGVCDENGEILLPMDYLNVRVLSLDRYWVETTERVGMVDGDGKWYYAIEKYAALMD